VLCYDIYYGAKVHRINPTASIMAGALFPDTQLPRPLFLLEATDPEWVEREDPVLIGQLQQRFEQMSRRVLDTQAEKVREVGGTIAQAHLRMGKAPTEIVDLAEELGAGVVVLGSRGLGGIRRALMGSVSDSVVRHAHCPVLVVRKDKSG
jgi:nucleotide-binding universal stress UspA family protein